MPASEVPIGAVSGDKGTITLPMRDASRLRYVCDPGRNSVLWHWQKWGEPAGIEQTTFDGWASKDEWKRHREEHWGGIYEALRKQEERSQMAFGRRMLADAQDSLVMLSDYLTPLRDKVTGELIRDSNGKVQYPVPFKTLEGAISAKVKLLETVERMMNSQLGRSPKDGDDAETPQRVAVLDQVSENPPMGQAEYRALARTMLSLTAGLKPNEADLLLDELSEGGNGNR